MASKPASENLLRFLNGRCESVRNAWVTLMRQHDEIKVLKTQLKTSKQIPNAKKHAMCKNCAWKRARDEITVEYVDQTAKKKGKKPEDIKVGHIAKGSALYRKTKERQQQIMDSS